MPLFIVAWGDGFDVTSLSQTQVDRYCAARRQSTITPLKPVTDETGATKGRKPVRVKDGTLDGDFRWLSSCLNWAHSFKVHGRRLLGENPLHDVTWPREKNVRRPVASHERFIRTLEQAGIIDPRGRLACILTLARHTGRRAEAICSLRASDVLLTRDQAARTLASMGRDESRAETWLHGAIRWRAENDKQGFDEIAPLGTAARRAIDDYLALEPRLGDVALFPAERDFDSPMRRDVASRWLLKAEKLAKLPKLEHGVFHCYRRLWAMERKNLPDVDVAAAGGWRDTRALKQSYQQADPATMLRVVEAS
jgi:integrase